MDCGNEADCLQMADSGNLAFDAIERLRTGPEIARQLGMSAALFNRYGYHERAKWLMEHAKFARGEPSIFDQLK